jgi:hypothetical protein
MASTASAGMSMLSMLGTGTVAVPVICWRLRLFVVHGLGK